MTEAKQGRQCAARRAAPQGASVLLACVMLSLTTHAAAVWWAEGWVQGPDAAPTNVVFELVEMPPAEPPTPAPVSEPEPEPMPKPALSKPRARRASPSRPSPAESAAPTAPVPAAEALAQGGPVDFTNSTFITGRASALAGGVSTGAGIRGVQGARKSAVGPRRAGGGRGEPSRARSVRLGGNEWQCDWPAAAVAEDIYEQFVVLRVVARADGNVERVTIVEDPGHGFGAAAMGCARRTRFTPARDALGAPVRATSPPIRVRFTR